MHLLKFKITTNKTQLLKFNFDLLIVILLRMQIIVTSNIITAVSKLVF